MFLCPLQRRLQPNGTCTARRTVSDVQEGSEIREHLRFLSMKVLCKKVPKGHSNTVVALVAHEQGQVVVRKFHQRKERDKKEGRCLAWEGGICRACRAGLGERDSPGAVCPEGRTQARKDFPGQALSWGGGGEDRHFQRCSHAFPGSGSPWHQLFA